ncbi:hypothetical protein [Tessaracoccus palaemonis]|uniref:LPXTG-motif cell wall anchor domain-containing protein n=1 Tax=Tessaracoccus palaemonis TaxID=2829499 RepID=A0ABX8SQZ0_9ACTN|nr:hypothetical protein [Tessaracoccus palaemonis]QXT63599.1 hypothetical protein KDB89_03740 [Tessaracoccus palaemonis]
MRLRPLFAALLLCLVLLPTRAAADGTATTIDECLAAGDVWLLVIDDADTTRANQCVGTPESGEAALAAGGMAIGYGKGILICTLDGYPDRCPSASSGDYWTYFHADASGGWDYSDSGAQGYRPPAGSVEGWCYTGGDARRCELPSLDEVRQLPVTANAAVALPSGTPWALIGTAAGLAAVVVVLVLLARRRSSGPSGALGGR